MNIFNTSPEEVIKAVLLFKEEQGRLRKKTNYYSWLNAAFDNELYVDDGVVRTRTLNKKTKE